MSLVDYASSSDEENDDEKQAPDDTSQPPAPPLRPPSPPRTEIAPSSQQSTITSHQCAPSIEKLPDASMLLNSSCLPSHQMDVTDHSSRVAAAMAESVSRKRESNGSALPFPQSKLPKGNLPHSRNAPDTVDGRLVPPQLSGRSNVVTEDISKLFVNKHADTSHGD